MKIIPSKTNIIIPLSLSFAGGVLSGFFGSGGGIFYILALRAYFGKTKNIFPTTVFISLFTGALNSVIYQSSEDIDTRYILPFICAGLAGAFAGCFYFDKFNTKALNIIFSILIIISGIISLGA